MKGIEVTRVAVATDQSSGAGVAVGWAAELARSWNAELVAIQVLAGERAGDEETGSNGRPDDLSKLKGELEAALVAEKLSVTAAVLSGDDIGAAIVDEAHRQEADVIVIGSSGMRGRKEFLLGNVANRVTHLAACTVIVVNTSTGKATIPIEESETLTARTQEISRTLGPIVLRQLSGRALRSGQDPEGPRQLREAFERLGPTFGKLGQILSTRPDLMPEEYLEELASLQSDVPPMAEEQVVSVMERELGVPWEDVFAEIDPEPLAAGTIGQVHRAKLVEGQRVVVKVRRPGAAEIVEQDLELLALAVKGIARIKRVRRVIDLPSMVEQVSAALRDELDFTREADHLDRMGSILASNRQVAVPACHRDLTRSGLLVMDEVVGGVPLSEAPESEARTDAARELLQASYKQVLDEGFFHADPHPGNLLWADDTIWMIDLGMVGRLDDETRRQLTLVLLAFVQGDVQMLADLSVDLSGVAGDVDLDMAAYRSDLALVVGGVQGRSLKEIQLIDLLNQLTALSVRHGVPLPPSFAMVGKALAQVELTVAELAPEIDPLEEAGRYFVRSIFGRVAGRLDLRQMFYEFERTRYRLTQIGDSLAAITGSGKGSKFEVEFSSDRLERKVIQAGGLIGLGFGAGLTWVAASMASGSERSGPRLKNSLTGVAGLLTAGLIAETIRSNR